MYLVTSAGRTSFDYFTRLSASFLQGKIYLTENPPWLTELIPAGPAKFYVPYPPMPAIAAISFVFLFGGKFEQQYLAHLFGAGIVALTMLIAWKIKQDKKLLIWTGLLTAFGNIMWFLSAVGSSWYLGQITAAFFLTFALYESLNKKRPFVTGLLLGAAFLARLQTVLSLPVFLYLFYERTWFKNYIKLGLGFLPFALFNFYYNFTRFGTIFDKGYFLIPGVMDEPWYQKGIFNLSYIPRHLKIIFGALPAFYDKFPFARPGWGGLAIWFTTPTFIYALLANVKERIVQLAWLSIVLISIVIFSHGTTGFAQFGYRFAVDFYPILLFLVIKGVSRTGVRWHHWVLLLISVLVNLWGVIWINKLGYV